MPTKTGRLVAAATQAKFLQHRDANDSRDAAPSKIFAKILKEATAGMPATRRLDSKSRVPKREGYKKGDNQQQGL